MTTQAQLVAALRAPHHGATPATRDEYLAACESAEIAPVPDSDLTGKLLYGLEHGDFFRAGYTNDDRIRVAIQRNRLEGIVVENRAADQPETAPARSARRTQIWEDCPSCGTSPIYLETGHCRHCRR